MREIVSGLIALCFLITSIMGSCPVYAQDFSLPAPGQMVALSPAYSPAVLKGLKLDAQNPFRFNFFVDTGDSNNSLSQEQLKQESAKLIKYFLASLTIPEKDLWVNLSPYEKNRIVPQGFGQTEMGRDLLAQDYLLKQLTASLIYPESQLGKEFWAKVYAQAQAKYGTTNIPINTFNKVWIIPDKAVVYENAGTAFVLENHLKVMLEEDYLSMSKHQSQLANALGTQIIREIVIPALTKEVNEGKNFAQLRQVFYSLILATWYKKKIKESILSKVYSNQNKIIGVNVSVKDKEIIYQQYLKAFKKGVFNYIKDSETPNGVSDATLGQSVPRKYFSGGVVGSVIPRLLSIEGPGQVDKAQLAYLAQSQSRLVNVLGDAAMTTQGVGEGGNTYRVVPVSAVDKKRAYQRPPLKEDDPSASLKLSDDFLRRDLLEELFKDSSKGSFADTQERFGQKGLVLESVSEAKVQDVFYIKDGKIEATTHAKLAQRGLLDRKF